MRLIGVAKNAVLRHSWILPNDSKHNGAGFSIILTASFWLRVAQMPRYRDLAIFVLTLWTQDSYRAAVVRVPNNAHHKHVATWPCTWCTVKNKFARLTSALSASAVKNLDC